MFMQVLIECERRLHREESYVKYFHLYSSTEDQISLRHPDADRGRILVQPPPGLRRSSPSPPAQGGEGWAILLNAPLPARSSRGEGEDFWWLHPDAPADRWTSH